jgi:hypothetical protein
MQQWQSLPSRAIDRDTDLVAGGDGYLKFESNERSVRDQLIAKYWPKRAGPLAGHEEENNHDLNSDERQPGVVAIVWRENAGIMRRYQQKGGKLGACRSTLRSNHDVRAAEVLRCTAAYVEGAAG